MEIGRLTTGHYEESTLGQGLLQVGDQVGHVLDARPTSGSGPGLTPTPVPSTLMWVILSGMLDQRFDPAETLGKQEEPRAFDQLARLLRARR